MPGIATSALGLVHSRCALTRKVFGVSASGTPNAIAVPLLATSSRSVREVHRFRTSRPSPDVPSSEARTA
ncbi:hypothetical protein PC116_g19337 [Phytophthora cactorum]|uniref:Uncharacterized protein n=1 Tax=Phytophthora cactorum TaxID=29920 RepID=A0A8T1K6Z6_9STRA|nr:hypothetical protein PC114_g22448 [Phytophthora cactorum]KAG2949641.1 hypothetical protein PC117_g5072 [Phytophthora cactorum]KAG2976502.1 hypothetical protein PC119_g22164 [Phytophthora cactorum]KAG3017953.1 hypothetical protein PC120_g10709 [Phytophthora cactorum]KAG3154598.1 hypothetical protein PC128_g22294 [Phytophthora cactorum]